MDIGKIVKAWRDDDYRFMLSDAEMAVMPRLPVGIAELSDADLEVVSGADTETYKSKGCCPTSSGYTCGKCSWTATCKSNTTVCM